MKPCRYRLGKRKKHSEIHVIFIFKIKTNFQVSRVCGLRSGSVFIPVILQRCWSDGYNLKCSNSWRFLHMYLNKNKHGGIVSVAFNFLFDLRNVRMVFAMSYFHDCNGLGKRQTDRGLRAWSQSPHSSTPGSFKLASSAFRRGRTLAFRACVLL